jgi:tagatose-1,6-bisphosphate aldolase
MNYEYAQMKFEVLDKSVDDILNLIIDDRVGLIMAENKAAEDKKRALNVFLLNQKKALTQKRNSVIIKDRDSIAVKFEKEELIKQEKNDYISKLESNLAEKMMIFSIEKVKARRKISDKFNYLV